MAQASPTTIISEPIPRIIRPGRPPKVVSGTTFEPKEIKVESEIKRSAASISQTKYKGQELMVISKQNEIGRIDEIIIYSKSADKDDLREIRVLEKFINFILVNFSYGSNELLTKMRDLLLDISNVDNGVDESIYKKVIKMLES